MLRGCPTARPQQEGTEEPKRDPQQEDRPDATGGKDIADYDLDVDSEGSEPKAELSAQQQREVDPDAEYTKNGNSPRWDLPPKDDASGTVHGDHAGT